MDVRMLTEIGRTQLEEICRRSAKVVPLGQTVCARVLDRYNMVLDTTDLSVAMPIALDGYWEMWMTQCVINNVKQGWSAIDVGASFGYYTLLLADLVGPGGVVEAWEPNPHVMKLLKQSLRLNGELSPRVLLVGAGASEGRTSEGMLLVPGHEDLGGASIIHPTREAAYARSNRIQRVQLDRLDNTEIEHVDFIKIDAEGHEREIWQGMSGLLEGGEPQCIMMEFTPKAYSTGARAFLKTIEEAGFLVSEISTDRGLLKHVDHGELVERQDWVPIWLTRAQKKQVSVP